MAFLPSNHIERISLNSEAFCQWKHLSLSLAWNSKKDKIDLVKNVLAYAPSYYFDQLVIDRNS